MKRGFHVAIVGPLPPPAGGMATQTRQLCDLLRHEGVSAEIVRTNSPYRPYFVAGLRGVRAAFRLVPYLAALWSAAGRASVFHVMANSGWAWYLFAVPAIRIGRLRGVRVVVNYRGGAAPEFLARSARRVKRALRNADVVAVPSGYLERVFADHGIATTIVPNVVDVERFAPRPDPHPTIADASVSRRTTDPMAPHIVIARNLEPIYDVATGLRAFALLSAERARARLSVAGSGPEATGLAKLACDLRIADAVRFSGTLSRDAMAELYRSATLLCNSSLADNTPNSLLEAMACEVPIVSTDVGGIPYLVQDGVTALLVPPRDPAALAQAMGRVLDDEALARRLVDNGLQLAQHCAWREVHPLWMRAYGGAEAGTQTASRQPEGANRRGAYTAFCADVLFPLHERLKGHATLAHLAELEESQWWTPERLRDAQFVRLKSFLERVARDVPFYARAFAEHDFEPRRMRDLSDVADAPFLTKALIRTNADALRAPGTKGLKRYNTGGSSGEPLVFYIGAARRAHDIAAKWRATRWFGVDIGDPEIVVWGSPIELGAQDRVRAVRDRLLRTELLPAFDMSPARLDEFVARIRASRPRMLFGYPSSLALIARHAEQGGVPMSELGIKVAFVTSERLYDEQRATIARVFGCRVANGYGGRDAGFIAHECPEGRLHISAEDIVVETIGGDGKPVAPGMPGEIVVTHLATGDFPFVRYRTGDIGVLAKETCACGRGLPVLAEVQGRTTDFVVARDGTIMHGLALIYVIRDLPGIEAFRIVQESLDRTRVEIVPDARFEAAIAQRIESGLKERLGSSVEVVVETVKEIPREHSGKFRYVQSRVASAALAA